MTIAPDLPAGPGPTDATIADADRACAALAVTSADMLSGLIATGMLQTVGRPSQLPQFLFPDLPAEQVREIWDLALTVGLAAGERRTASRWQPEALDQHRTALDDAGYTAMGNLVAATAAHGRSPAPEPHPSDYETARGGHQ